MSLKLLHVISKTKITVYFIFGAVIICDEKYFFVSLYHIYPAVTKAGDHRRRKLVGYSHSEHMGGVQLPLENSSVAGVGQH